jgi:hypothetical protein
MQLEYDVFQLLIHDAKNKLFMRNAVGEVVTPFCVTV